jgi:hypothetical protein
MKIITGYVSGVQFPVGSELLSSSQQQISEGLFETAVQLVPRVLNLGMKRPETESNRSLNVLPKLTFAEFNTYTILHVLMFRQKSKFILRVA